MTEVIHTLDIRGLGCPLPVLKTGKAIAGMQAGEMLEITAGDAGTARIRAPAQGRPLGPTTRQRGAAAAGHAARLHVAAGGELGLNGNYAAGILEGVLHFHPEWLELLEEHR